MKTYAMGAIQSPPDARDYRLSAAVRAALPEKYMRDPPPVIDQGQFSNCVAQACCYASKSANGPDFDPNWVYGRREDTDYQGPGWYIRLALKTLNSEGNVPASGAEALEVTEVQEYVKKNASKLLARAKDYKIEAYALLSTAEEIKTALVNGMRVVFAAPITSFETDKDFLFRCTINTYGGHAMSIWGYDGNLFRVQNSWGTGWGDGGRCWMMAEDILRWKDCWAITDTPTEAIVDPGVTDKAVRYTGRIKTATKGNVLKVRKTSKSNDTEIGRVKDSSTVLVLTEHGTRREICFGDGRTYLVGWIPASYINAAAGYRNTDEEG